MPPKAMPPRCPELSRQKDPEHPVWYSAKGGVRFCLCHCSDEQRRMVAALAFTAWCHEAARIEARMESDEDIKACRYAKVHAGEWMNWGFDHE